MRALATPELTLEPQVLAHAEEMFVVLSDPAIYEYEGQPPASIDWLRERFTRLESRRSANGVEHWLNWVLRLPPGELIGYVQATVFTGGRADIAYLLASAYWGRGLAQVAVRAMMAELVAHYDVRSFSATHKLANLRSHRLLERLGFAEAGPEDRMRRLVDPDEMLMVREA